MTTPLDEFINRYFERLRHKAEPELRAKISDPCFIAEATSQANEIVKEIVKI